MHLNHWVFQRSIHLPYHPRQVFSVVKNTPLLRSVILTESRLVNRNSQIHLNISSMLTCLLHLLHPLHLSFNQLNHPCSWKVMIHSVEATWSINSMNHGMSGHHKRIISTKPINQQHLWTIIRSSMHLITMPQNSEKEHSFVVFLTIRFRLEFDLCVSLDLYCSVWLHLHYNRRISSYRKIARVIFTAEISWQRSMTFASLYLL